MNILQLLFFGVSGTLNTPILADVGGDLNGTVLRIQENISKSALKLSFVQTPPGVRTSPHNDGRVMFCLFFIPLQA